MTSQFDLSMTLTDGGEPTSRCDFLFGSIVDLKLRLPGFAAILFYVSNLTKRPSEDYVILFGGLLKQILGSG